MFYRRNLPHWQPANQSFFLTWRLDGSLPESVLSELRATRKYLRSNPSVLEYKRLFVKIDRILDAARTGSRWLAEPAIAAMVQDALLEKYSDLYKLWAYVVMSNHLHLFLKPNPGVELEKITQRLKGFTAREANRLLGRTGQRFWQIESFDHWPRNQDEFFRIVDYIENNPVKAGLVKLPEDWIWSSAAERKRRGWNRFRGLT